MCGIIGYIGKEAVRNAVAGLKHLEYRGYDSAGVATLANGDFKLVRSVGKVDVLATAAEPYFALGNLAISHCRWATHGGITEANAHPHIVGDVAVVHNGIIDNFTQLKDALLDQGRQFNSETDTEVIAHLIDLAPGNLLDKVKAAVSQLEGSYALAVISKSEPDKIVVTRKHSPLILGEFVGGCLVASDLQAILPYTNDVMILEDGDFAVLGEQLYTSRPKSYTHIPWTNVSQDKGAYASFMEKEIFEQPVALINTVVKNDWEQIRCDLLKLIDGRELILTACGTSYHSCEIGAMWMEKESEFRAQAIPANELKYCGKKVNDKSLVLAVSQSGETADVLQAVRYAKERGAKVVSVINVLGSSLAQLSDLVIYTAAGPEISVASTKSFTSQLLVLLGLSALLAGKSFGRDSITDLVEAVQTTLGLKEQAKQISQTLANKKNVLLLGKGVFVPVAKEGALKLKEISYLNAEGMSSSELKHGPIALIESGYPVIVLAPNNKTYSRAISSIHEIKARGGTVIAVSGAKIDAADYTIIVSQAEDSVSVFVVSVVVQMIAHYTALARKCSPDRPRNLAKSVTVE